MKKSILTLIILTFVSISSFAQIRTGLTVGLNLADVAQKVPSGFEKEPTKLLPGFHAGFVMDITASDLIHIRPSLLFTQKGYSYDVQEAFGAPDDDYLRVKNNYISLPVNIVFQISDFEFFFGPYAAIAISGKAKVSMNGNTDSQNIIYDNDVTVADDYNQNDIIYKKTDFGAQIGLGYNFDAFKLSANYSRGFTDIEPKIEGTANTDSKVSNSVIQVSLSYFFN